MLLLSYELLDYRQDQNWAAQEIFCFSFAQNEEENHASFFCVRIFVQPLTKFVLKCIRNEREREREREGDRRVGIVTPTPNSQN